MTRPQSPSLRLAQAGSTDGTDDALKTSSRKLAKLQSVDGVTIVPSPKSVYRASTNTTSHDTSLQVSIAIRRGRVAFLTAATVLVLLFLVFTFRRGVELKTITDTEKTPEQQAKLLDDYNSYSGNIASLFGTPVERFVAAAVQVILLRFLTRAIMADEPTWKISAVAGGVGLLAAYLISNGFTALNVQLRPRGLDAVISAQDLSLAFNQSLPGMSTNMTHSYPETQLRNPITNTMLRNAVLPRVLNQQPHCDGESVVTPDVDITFGFAQRDWQSRVLQEAPPVKQLRTSIEKNVTILDGAKIEDMPMNASLAANLYLYGMELMSIAFGFTVPYLNATEISQRIPLSGYDNHGVPSLPAQPNTSLAQVVGLLPPASNGSTRSSGEQTSREFFLIRSLTGLRSQFKAAGNTSTSQINMTLSHVPISDGIVFDAITFEFEVDPMLMADESTKDNSTRYLGIARNRGCSPVAGRCRIPKVLYGSNDFQYDPPAQVQALGACVNKDGNEELRAPAFTRVYPSRFDCDQSSNSSMLVFSIGKRVTAASMASNTYEDSRTKWENFSLDYNVVTNARKIFTVTIGRLHWQWKSLSSDFGASCDDRDFSSSCLGLHFPLANASGSTKNQTLVAGANTLPLAKLSPFRKTLQRNYQRLVPLAMVRELPKRTTSTDDYDAGDVVLPHNVQSANWTAMYGGGFDCLAPFEENINSTFNNHFYNEHGLQAAYTAAVFFLFQNAVVRDVIALDTNGAVTLDFAHNVRHLAVWLSVPDQSVWLTVAGCVLLVAGLAAAMLETVTLSKSKSDSLANITAPHVIARVMLDEGQFPPLLLHRHVVSSDYSESGELMHRKVEQFAINSLGLQHQEDQDRLTAVV